MAFLLALGLTLYPVISNYVNQKYASQIHTAYQEVMEQADDSELLKAKINEMDEKSFAQYLRFQEYLCEKPEFLGASNHLLFVAEKETSPETR